MNLKMLVVAMRMMAIIAVMVVNTYEHKNRNMGHRDDDDELFILFLLAYRTPFCLVTPFVQAKAIMKYVLCIHNVKQDTE